MRKGDGGGWSTRYLFNKAIVGSIKYYFDLMFSKLKFLKAVSYKYSFLNWLITVVKCAY